MHREINIGVGMRRGCGSRGSDAVIAEIAARQHGVVSHPQLLAIGLSPEAIVRRIRAGRLHEIHLGVYAVGHRAVSREGELLAAVLAGGPAAVLSHWAAAELWELQLGKEREIGVIACTRGERPGIRFHRCRLEPHEIAMHKSIPVTTAERTIVDLAAHLSSSRLEHVIRQAEYEHLTTTASLTSCLSTYEGRRGMKALRTALALTTETSGATRSSFEKRFLRFIRRHGLPRPKLNYRIELPTREVFADCAWPERRLIAELDSQSAHHNHFSFDSDRARDRGLLVAGWTSTRITWRQLREGEQQLADELRALLA
jgi:very-short-patch-repair endonuclease